MIAPVRWKSIRVEDVDRDAIEVRRSEEPTHFGRSPRELDLVDLARVESELGSALVVGYRGVHCVGSRSVELSPSPRPDDPV